ncbi:MAG: hypothetical protein LBR08_04580 [Bacteroidales bacterium]|nr:hypothetical protein [Bacteroidales bacterium]
MFRCKICGTRFSETRNTIFFNSHCDSATTGKIIRCISEGNQMDAHLRRKSLTFAKEKPYFEAKLNIIIFICL